jgi:hypothetical protein
VRRPETLPAVEPAAISDTLNHLKITGSHFRHEVRRGRQTASSGGFSFLPSRARFMTPGGRIALGFTAYSGQPNKGLSETLNAAGFEKARDRTFSQSSGSVSRTLPTPRMPALLARSMS